MNIKLKYLLYSIIFFQITFVLKYNKFRKVHKLLMYFSMNYYKVNTFM